MQREKGAGEPAPFVVFGHRLVVGPPASSVTLADPPGRCRHVGPAEWAATAAARAAEVYGEEPVEALSAR